MPGSSVQRAVPVCCVLIERDGLVLVAQRPPGKHLAHKWEFPGGKIETHESASEALHREIAEELHCRLSHLRPLILSTHDYTDTRIVLHPFVARLAAGSPEPSAREHVAIRWIEPRELLTLDLAAADIPVAADYLSRNPNTKKRSPEDSARENQTNA